VYSFRKAATLTFLAPELDSGVIRVIMLPDVILAVWRIWLVWCQISQIIFVLLMHGPLHTLQIHPTQAPHLSTPRFASLRPPCSFTVHSRDSMAATPTHLHLPSLTRVRVPTSFAVVDHMPPPIPDFSPSSAAGGGATESEPDDHNGGRAEGGSGAQQHFLRGAVIAWASGRRLQSWSVVGRRDGRGPRSVDVGTRRREEAV